MSFSHNFMRRSRTLVAIAAVTLLAGCPGATFRVIEYDANSVFGRVGGCAIHRSTEEGKEAFVLQYNGERCAVRAVGGPQQ